MKYIDADTIADAKNAYGCRVPLDHIAGHLGITVGELRVALDLPQMTPEPQQTQTELPFDLFRTDELQDQL